MEKMLPIRLSSKETIHFKWVLPPFWIGLFSFATCLAFAGVFQDHETNEPPPFLVCWILLIMTIVGSFFLIFFAYRLKNVELLEDHLLVSELDREEKVPLVDIAKIEKMELRFYLIRIQFLRKTLFGKTIWFIPKGEASEMLQVLQGAVAKARGEHDFQTTSPLR